jgi:RNA polymerase sigma-70 factor (ECF subfamily)
MDANDGHDVTLAQAGDETAFRRLVERHGRGVFQLAYRLTGSEPDAEDVVQEAFLKAYRELKRFEAR